MTNDERHNEISENLPAFLLDGLDPDEEAAVREHLRGCDECQQELSSYGPLRDALNLSANNNDMSLPVGARERLLQRTRNVRSLPTMPSASPPPPEALDEARLASRSPSSSRLPRILAAASLLVVVLLGSLLFQQNRQLGGEVAEKQKTINSVVDLMERADLRVEDLSTSGSDVRARVYAAREGDVGMFVFDSLPSLPEGKVYQLWVGETAAVEENAGTFVPTDSEKGSYHKLLNPPGGFDKYRYVGITVSPEGGLQEPPPPSDPSWVVKSELPEYMQANRGQVLTSSRTPVE